MPKEGISWVTLLICLHICVSGVGYHWKGLYVESMVESLYRGYQTKKADLSDVGAIPTY